MNKKVAILTAGQKASETCLKSEMKIRHLDIHILCTSFAGIQNSRCSRPTALTLPERQMPRRPCPSCSSTTRRWPAEKLHWKLLAILHFDYLTPKVSNCFHWGWVEIRKCLAPRTYETKTELFSCSYQRHVTTLKQAPSSLTWKTMIIYDHQIGASDESCITLQDPQQAYWNLISEV